jgi:sugar lactone lactonase YvrE
MKKLFKVLLIAVAVFMILPSVVSAATPYATYTYSAGGQVLTSPAAYVPDTVVDAAYMGLNGTIDDPRDLLVGPDERVYIVDAASASVKVLDRYYKFLFEIKSFTNEHGVPDTFLNPSGVFVNDKYIYVCDTDNNRIVMFDLEGNYVKIVGKPVSNLFEEGSIYKPVACAVDDYGRIFVVSSTTYQGIIVLNDNGDFFGFIGAQKVAISALEIIWRNIQTEEQRAQSEEYVSTEFNNITIDGDNFIYVTTSSIAESDQQGAINSKSKASDYAPVKKLNASGSDVMKRNGFYPPSGEVRITNMSTASITGASKIIDAAVGPEGTCPSSTKSVPRYLPTMITVTSSSPSVTRVLRPVTSTPSKRSFTRATTSSSSIRPTTT